MAVTTGLEGDDVLVRWMFAAARSTGELRAGGGPQCCGLSCQKRTQGPVLGSCVEGGGAVPLAGAALPGFAAAEDGSVSSLVTCTQGKGLYDNTGLRALVCALQT